VEDAWKTPTGRPGGPRACTELPDQLVQQVTADEEDKELQEEEESFRRPLQNPHRHWAQRAAGIEAREAPTC